MRKGVKAAVMGGVFTVVVGGAGYGAFNIVSALSGGGGTGASGGGSEVVRTGPPTAAEAKETTRKFFAAWEKGDGTAAASYTNNEETAAQLLNAYGEEARITKVHIAPSSPVGATVPFTVKATVSYDGKSEPLDYSSELRVVRGQVTHRALVDWEPSVVHPRLQRGDTLVTEESASPPIKAVDRDGTVLTKEDYPSLGPILDALREKYGEEAGGRASVELVIRHPADGTPDTPLLTLVKGRPGRLRTTLSAGVQAAAEKAVRKYAESSVVALKPSTGEVLAVANHRQDGFNAAFLGKVAPGSTMKIVTAAMLIDHGVTSASGPAPCTPDAMWEGQTFHNLKDMTPDEKATLSESFARSCNTAFVKFTDDVKSDWLAREAEDRFGLGRDNWQTGIQSFDGRVPATEGPDKAAVLIGQGQIEMNPLNMASVTATAMTGVFHQPVVVPLSLDDREPAHARGLASGTVQQLRAMMNRTAVGGTASGIMSRLSGSIGAKTGSAEVDGQSRSDSWFTGYRNDMAAAAMTQDGGHGIDASGPIVADVLQAGG
ncbi:penicillin-binding transpeptidase domain-containing protein [Streptomyces sp. V3I7]|uniref:penicillin-binding transpeptidase domain-containing protein n=1 Tax=Streptomyces sp. V3I7 TaxID=3042278 RepID=UPI002782DC59|nr:penicillin-binding transpeptidase domain-containing protein [Streptomyces sp. V3I7]MDQ0991398.1 hypothetical protein [Streptomyces sp. V3I7]